MSRCIPELGLGAAALGLAVLLALPWGARRPPGSSGGRQPASSPVLAEAEADSAPGLPPRELAALFGWREARAAPAPAGPSAQPAQEAPWIQPLGYVVEQDGIRSYLFKDLRTRTVLSLKQGLATRGWKLLEARERDFLLEFDGQPFIIRRRP